MNYYEMLEVSQNASPEVIKAAYKSLMQRYHPDKNPGDAGIAAHALKVVQAYEVLSDSEKRAAYDIVLMQQLTDSLHASRDSSRGAQALSVAKELQGANEKTPYWLLWLLISLIIVIVLYAMFLLKNRHLDEFLKINPEIHGQEAGERVKEVLPRTIPVYVSDLSVELRDSERFPGGPARVLDIPVLGVRVGAFDANKVLRYLDSNKELIRKNLEEKLVYANYDELIKIDGEQYLKNIVMDSIGDTTGTNGFKGDPINGVEATGQYGVVDVLLPGSYSVR
jgi:hypothetical protein